MLDTVTSGAPAAAGVANPVLAVENLQAWYGESHVLHGITFDVREGEVVTLLGRNGAGKIREPKRRRGAADARDCNAPARCRDGCT